MVEMTTLSAGVPAEKIAIRVNAGRTVTVKFESTQVAYALEGFVELDLVPDNGSIAGAAKTEFGGTANGAGQTLEKTFTKLPIATILRIRGGAAGHAPKGPLVITGAVYAAKKITLSGKVGPSEPYFGKFEVVIEQTQTTT